MKSLLDRPHFIGVVGILWVFVVALVVCFAFSPSTFSAFMFKIVGIVFLAFLPVLSWMFYTDEVKYRIKSGSSK